jgi:hypothetical protein
VNAREWNQAVLAHPAEHLAKLDQTRNDNGLGAVPTFARPVIADAADLEPISRDLGLIHSAISKLVRGWARGTAGEHVRLTPEVAALARAAIDRSELLGFTRYDVVYGAGHRDFHVLECQAGDPSGPGWADAFTAGFPAHGLRRFRIVDSIAALIRAQLPGVERPSIAFVCASDSFVRSDHVLMARACIKAGMQCAVADVRELIRKSDGLYAGGVRIDLCLRDTIDELVLEPWRNGGKVLLDAWRDGVTRVLNPFGAIAADDKSFFDALSTGTGDFTAEERAALQRRIPWTRVLNVALQHEVLERRAQLVLKPADGYGGFGVVIGAECDDALWKAKVVEALASPKVFVAQQYLPLPEEELPVFTSGGAVSLERLRVVGSFWWINDRFAGAYHRASVARVINVHQGGGLTPTFFADP